MGKTSSIKGVLFDLDGTLVDTEALILASFRYATKTVLGRDIPDEELRAKIGQPAHGADVGLGRWQPRGAR